MTVTELLAAIQGAYPGSTGDALRTFIPVFHKRFRAREGDSLQAAADEVFATFNATSRKPFPIPADFEPHMPNIHRQEDGKGGPPIRAWLEARRIRVTRLYAAWFDDQGAKIKAARHQSVYGACVLEVMDLCHAATDQTRRIILSAEQIAKCEMRAASSERALRFQPAKTNEVWDDQIAQVRASWAHPQEKDKAA